MSKKNPIYIDNNPAETTTVYRAWVAPVRDLGFCGHGGGFEPGVDPADKTLSTTYFKSRKAAENWVEMSLGRWTVRSDGTPLKSRRLLPAKQAKKLEYWLDVEARGATAFVVNADDEAVAAGGVTSRKVLVA